jgi:hypothetical protein
VKVRRGEEGKKTDNDEDVALWMERESISMENNYEDESDPGHKFIFLRSLL